MQKRQPIAILYCTINKQRKYKSKIYSLKLIEGRHHIKIKGRYIMIPYKSTKYDEIDGYESILNFKTYDEELGSLNVYLRLLKALTESPKEAPKPPSD